MNATPTTPRCYEVSWRAANFHRETLRIPADGPVAAFLEALRLIGQRGLAPRAFVIRPA